MMIKEIQYELYIGCADQQSNQEIISLSNLKETVTDYFEKKQIGFSVVDVQGGYLYHDGRFSFSNTLCITIIGDQHLDIIRLGRNLSEMMNQECFLITKNELKMEYR